ncbi:MAG: hypothetical protein ABT03_14665 [Comamonas sp. SCN 67-35]|uniref:hypothetical protein n=1 Tax=Comamonas sp. SCN 67-35 TaxID=1660096 RepID=UPI00086E44E1|nr:hypothetical protein [Comamonas sp. SCN 67-35]ODU36951.1 MAG: hypothetical protein ABT03_14665 [Comamonas sp. SCN 67-35]OJV73921.1 MAG: hypothetical protein BGO35_03955 [Burkholderiales bacterium 64-34]
MNVFSEFQRLLPQTPTYVGTVLAVAGAGAATWATVQIAGGGILHARGEASVGQRVFVRAGLIEGGAPELAYWETQV